MNKTKKYIIWLCTVAIVSFVITFTVEKVHKAILNNTEGISTCIECDEDVDSLRTIIMQTAVGKYNHQDYIQSMNDLKIVRRYYEIEGVAYSLYVSNKFGDATASVNVFESLKNLSDSVGDYYTAVKVLDEDSRCLALYYLNKGLEGTDTVSLLSPQGKGIFLMAKKCPEWLKVSLFEN